MLAVPPAPPPDVAVGARPDAPPVVSLPVGEVVARAMLGAVQEAVDGCPGSSARRTASPVTHLVPFISRSPEKLVRKLVHVGREVVVGLGDLAATNLPGQLGAV